MITAITVALALGTAPAQPSQWLFELTMTMSDRPAVRQSPPISRERCQAMVADTEANRVKLESAGGVRIHARCVPTKAAAAP